MEMLAAVANWLTGGYTLAEILCRHDLSEIPGPLQTFPISLKSGCEEVPLRIIVSHDF